MSQESKNIVYQHKLQVMQDQNNELMRQITILKQSNEALLAGLTDIESLRQENYTLALQNRQLTDMLQSEKKRCEQLQARRYGQTKSLKQELNQRINYIQRMRIQHEKQLFRQSQELRQAKNQVRQKRNENLQQLTRSMAISSCLLDLKPSMENSMERSSNISYSNIERRSSKSPIHSRLTYLPKHSQEYQFVKKQKENEYTNYSKQEIKVALRALNKAGKSLREGSFQVSMLQDRKSCVKRQ